VLRDITPIDMKGRETLKDMASKRNITGHSGAHGNVMFLRGREWRAQGQPGQLARYCLKTKYKQKG
jgi:hypothetical protein